MDFEGMNTIGGDVVYVSEIADIIMFAATFGYGIGTVLMRQTLKQFSLIVAISAGLCLTAIDPNPYSICYFVLGAPAILVLAWLTIFVVWWLTYTRVARQHGPFNPGSAPSLLDVAVAIWR